MSHAKCQKIKFKVFRNFPLVVVLVIFELLPTFFLCEFKFEFKFKFTACSREIILCFFVYKFVRSSLILLFKLRIFSFISLFAGTFRASLFHGFWSVKRNMFTIASIDCLINLLQYWKPFKSQKSLSRIMYAIFYL